MKAFDRVLQAWRIDKARPHIGQNARVLDIGCADGRLFDMLGSHIREGVGIDPELAGPVHHRGYQLIAGWFPRDLPDDRPFDVITMLAVLEHVPPSQQPQLAEDCARYLKPGGRLVMTVPSPLVDPLLYVLQKLRLLDGMSTGQHYGFDTRLTPRLFTRGGLRLIQAKRFQLGLNNLFVFQKAASLADGNTPDSVCLQHVPDDARPLA